MTKKRLFVCIPNNSGSTLLHGYLSRCKSIIGHPITTDDSHLYAEYGPWAGLEQRPWTEDLEKYQNPKNYNWDTIDWLWHKEWKKNHNYLSGKVLMGRSPDNIMRIDLLAKAFPGSYFIVGVRNPYAASEGLRRRHNYDIARCGKHFLECMKLACRDDQENAFEAAGIDYDSRRIMITNYEEIVHDSEYFTDCLKYMLPELYDVTLDAEAQTREAVDGKKHRKLENLNDKQIANLSDKDIQILNELFEPHEELLQYHGYKFISSYEMYRNTAVAERQH